MPRLLLIGLLATSTTVFALDQRVLDRARIHGGLKQKEDAKRKLAGTTEYAQSQKALTEQKRKLVADAYDSFGDFYTSAWDPVDISYALDLVWIVVAALFCFFLQAGFGLLEAGALRSKNAKNIMLKNLMDACVGGFVYYLFGYAICYQSPGDGTGNPFAGGGNMDSPWFPFTGYQAWMLSNVPDYEYYLFLFQYVFAATIATIVSGAVAERIQFKAYMVYSFVLTGFIYPFAAHWTWSGDGFLNKLGVFDYAGGNAVHALSGITAWMAALALGPRIGKFVDGKPVELACHNVPYMVLGTFILWLGFIPFIAGSPCVLNFQVGRMAVMTTLNGCFGGCFALLYEVVVNKTVSVEGACIGVLAGMVGICTSCGVCPLWTTCFINTPISVLSYYFGIWLNNKLKVDDPLGASALHYWPGAVSMIFTGFFAHPKFVSKQYGYNFIDRNSGKEEDFVGVFYGGNGQQLGIQCLALLIMTVYGAGASGMLFYGMKMCKILRVSEEDEIAGMDNVKHGGPAYTDEDVAPKGKVKGAKMDVSAA